MKTRTRKTRNGTKQLQNPGALKPVSGATPALRRLLGLPRWTIILLTVALVAGASFAAFELLLPGRIPPELVGQWRVVGGELSGMTLEFKRNGSMTGKALVNGQENVIEGEAEVTGNTLRTTTTNPFTAKSETGTQTIVSLTETELITQDAKGTRIKMVRVQ
jgi:uncharacterized protein (TIGR03066 family)